MHIINTPDITQARREIDSLSSKKEKVIVMSQDDEFNKKILENKKVNVFIINEQLNLKDYMKQRNSQLNEEYSKLACKNNIKIAIDIDSIIKKSDIEKAKSLARLTQNIKLCRKNKAELVFYESNKEQRALQSLLLTLGASTNQAKKAILTK